MEPSQCNEKSYTCDNQLCLINWCEVSCAISLLWQSVLRKLGSRMPRKQAACFSSESWWAWECQQRGSIQRHYCSQDRDAFVWCLGCGKEGQERKVSNAEKTPTDRNLSSQVSQQVCWRQRWETQILYPSELRDSSYGLACELIIWTFWHAALIWRLHSFISKWNFTAPHVHFIWGTIYHPSSN